MIRFSILLVSLLGLHVFAFANEPDSVYLFSYSIAKDNGRSGLHFAWSQDKTNWVSIGNRFSYVRSDYGRWGSEKQMNSPYLLQGADGQWHCIWSLNDQIHQLAYAASADLVTWGRQLYPYLPENSSFRQPVVKYEEAGRQYLITYVSGNSHYRLTTADFKTYSPPVAVPASQYQDDRVTINLPGGRATGTLSRVSWKLMDGLVKAAELKHRQNRLGNESVKEDSLRFAGEKPLHANIRLQPGRQKPISDLLVGVFFEDINYAADGGLYAELVQNRDFEYALSDKGWDQAWTSTHSWSTKGHDLRFTIDTTAPIHANNPHYAVIDVQQPGGALVNSGYDGIAVQSGERYLFSLFARTGTGKSSKLLVKLVNKDGNVLAQTTLSIAAGDRWKKYNATLTAGADTKEASLVVQPLAAGRMMLDMVSLFPQQTFKNRPNGLRTDLAQTIAAIRPRFIRFPGGCVAHGDGLENIYRWKNTIGPLESRKPQRNLWGYHQSTGLGYYEYFQYCEDIGATPLPVVAAGVPCQNSGTVKGVGGGQQGGIALPEMDEYVQEVLDLVEWANGPVTSPWGKLRAEAGHPKPFNLKYIGIGNEDLITDVFEERFTLIYKAVQQRYPNIRVIGTVGPSFEGTDYEQGWDLATKLKLPLVDEHYYQSPGWFINNQQFYDHYDRNKPKVYLGEYASQDNTLYNALAEAAYLTGIERNGDVVSMTSYAPLLAKEGHTQWNPDMIYFNNTEVKPTTSYEVQKLYGQHAGNTYIPTDLSFSSTQETVKKRFAVSVVQDALTKDLIVKIVNLLPTETIASLDLKEISLADHQAEKWCLSGSPADRNTKAIRSNRPVGEQLQERLPPYSFTVLRLKTK